MYNALLTLNFLNPIQREQQLRRDCTIEKTTELNQPVYFKDVLTSEQTPGNVLPWGRGFNFVSTGEENLRISSKLAKIQFKKERPLIKEK